jgi:YHS domain-containing protein
MAKPVELFAVDTAGNHQQHVDPVCRMHVAAASATTLSREGRTYRFCSRACANQFDTWAVDPLEPSDAQ